MEPRTEPEVHVTALADWDHCGCLGGLQGCIVLWVMMVRLGVLPPPTLTLGHTIYSMGML